MLRPLALSTAVVAAVGLSMINVDSAQAWFRRGGGSCGSGGGYSSHGSFGSSGSFGGLFSQRGNRCGDESCDYGCEESESSHGSCGSHGGAYYGDHRDGYEHHAGYGPRSDEYGRDRDFDPGEAPPAPSRETWEREHKDRDHAKKNESDKAKSEKDNDHNSDKDSDEI